MSEHEAAGMLIIPSLFPKGLPVVVAPHLSGGGIQAVLLVSPQMLEELNKISPERYDKEANQKAYQGTEKCQRSEPNTNGGFELPPASKTEKETRQ